MCELLFIRIYVLGVTSTPRPVRSPRGETCLGRTSTRGRGPVGWGPSEVDVVKDLHTLENGCTMDRDTEGSVVFVLKLQTSSLNEGDVRRLDPSIPFFRAQRKVQLTFGRFGSGQGYVVEMVPKGRVIVLFSISETRREKLE